MRSYIDRRPRGWPGKPKWPVIVLTAEEEATARSPAYGVSDLAREVRRKADDILIRHSGYDRVCICTAAGVILQTVYR